jgi:hypothetical protein
MACLSLAAAPAMAANGNILITFDQAGALCQQTLGMGGMTTAYVYALLQGASGSGITGAEYRIDVGDDGNADAGWLFSESFDPAATTIGSGAITPADPALRGINVAWGTCQTGDGTKVLLETIQIFNAGGSTAELRLKVVKHSTPSNQFFQCPLFTLCDAPFYTKVCLGSNLTTCRNPEPPFPMNATCSSSGEAFLNPGPTRNCTVAVSPATWSQVKNLYTNN